MGLLKTASPHFEFSFEPPRTKNGSSDNLRIPLPSSMALSLTSLFEFSPQSEMAPAATPDTPAWTPQAGTPQERAYHSDADIIGYGGAAGGGKTDLLLGLAGTQHQRSVIFRRVFPSLRGIIERSREIFNGMAGSHAKDSYNESLHVWRLADGRMIEFGACQYEDDRKKWQGQPHDFYGFDEATEFPEALVRFLIGWNRTTKRGQRCRVVLTFNPPMDDAGDWVTAFFGPWLDAQHPDPAVDGELRWYAMLDGKETPVSSGEPFDHDGDTITPKSRTFFHAKLSDNPILAASGYGATIDAMPEPLRSLLRGNFNAARVTDPWQVIPAAWVRAAQARWTEQPPDEPLLAIGQDVARGGDDKTVIARFYGQWLAPIDKYPGISTPDGPTAAALVIPYAAPEVPINVDVIGVGGSVYDCLAAHDLNAQAINFSESAPDNARDRSGRLKFRNVRAHAYWALREALDPDHGDSLALPPDSELLADLCAAKWKISPSGVQIESKDDIKIRIGRSPDCGDAVVLAWYAARRADILVGFV